MITILEVINPGKEEGLVRGLEQMDLAVRETDKQTGQLFIVVDREQFGGDEVIDFLRKLGIMKEIGT
jgi:hypothetical protein